MTKQKLTTVTTKEAVSSVLGIPIAHVKALKKMGCPAAAISGRYYLKEITDWYKKNKEAVLDYCEDNKSANSQGMTHWKTRRAKAECLIAEIHLAEKQRNSLDKETTVKFLRKISDAQTNLFRQMSQALPAKLLNKNITEIGIEIGNANDLLCKTLQKPMAEWHL